MAGWILVTLKTPVTRAERRSYLVFILGTAMSTFAASEPSMAAGAYDHLPIFSSKHLSHFTQTFLTSVNLPGSSYRSELKKKKDHAK